MFSQEAFISTFVLSLSLCSAWGKGDCLLSVTEQSNHIILRASAEEAERCLYLCDKHAPVTEFSLFVLLRQLCLRFTFKASGGVWKKTKNKTLKVKNTFYYLCLARWFMRLEQPQGEGVNHNSLICDPWPCYMASWDKQRLKGMETSWRSESTWISKSKSTLS